MPDASVAFADLRDVLERLVIGVDEEHGRLEVAPEAFGGPDYATSFEVKGGPGSFVSEGAAANENDGAYGTVGSLLLKGCAEAVDAGVAEEAKGKGVVGDDVPVRVDQDRGCGEFMENLADDCFHFRGEDELDTPLEQCVNEAGPSGQVLQEFAVVVSNASDE